MADLIRQALKAVPSTRWALSIAGSISLLALVVGQFRGVGGTFIAGITILILMILMFLFAALSALHKGALRTLALVLAWSFMALFIGSAFVTTSSLFFDSPPFDKLIARVRMVTGDNPLAAERSQSTPVATDPCDPSFADERPFDCLLRGR